MATIKKKFLKKVFFSLMARPLPPLVVSGGISFFAASLMYFFLGLDTNIEIKDFLWTGSGAGRQRKK